MAFDPQMSWSFMPPWLSPLVTETPQTLEEIAAQTDVASADEIHEILCQAVEHHLVNVALEDGKYSRVIE